MTPWKVILATLVIFVAGLVTGGLLVNRFAVVKPPPSGVPLMAQRMEVLHRIGRQLDLNPEQRERIEAIFRENQQQMKKLWEPIAPQIREETRRVKESILVELTPAQAKNFEELLKQHSRTAKPEPVRRKHGEPADAPQFSIPTNAKPRGQ